MSDIFVSWGSPDASLARRIIRRLRDEGLDVVEYESSMTAGDDILEWVRGAIRGARTVLVLVSPDTRDRPWLRTELDLALDAQARGEAERVMLVRLAGLGQEGLPEVPGLPELRSFGLDPVPDEEDSLLRLVEDVRSGLGASAPLVVPTALLAMTREEFDAAIPRDGRGIALLETLCAKVGMRRHQALREQLEQRYGDTPEDFAPFGTDPLTRLMDTALGAANRRRGVNGNPPIHLRWVSRQDFGDQEVRQLWQRRYSFLIIDSVSVFSQAIGELIGNLPHMDEGRNLAVVWVPPYTRHTVELEALIGQSLQVPSFLADRFTSWRGPGMEYPYLAFDVATATTLQRWVVQALESFSDQDRPNPRNLRLVTGASPRAVALRPSRFNPSTARGELP